MDIHQLRVFVSVFKNRSFSKASQELRLTQPTVSSHVMAMEEEFNCKLFDRLGRTIIPTREAEVFYSHAMEIIGKADALKEVMGKFKKEITGNLVIGASTIPGTYLIPQMMAAFQKRFPSISFEILISDSKKTIDGVSKNELFLGIVGAKLGNDRINYMPFAEDELIVVSSPTLIKNNRMALNTLVGFPMVLREEGSGTRTEAEKILEAKGVSHDGIRIAGIFGSTEAVKQAVKGGLGVSILSKFSVIDELEHKMLKEIKLTDVHQMKRKFYIVTHKKRTLPPAYSIFLEHIIAESKHV